MVIGFAEGAVTRLRREFKLVLAEGEAAELCARLGQELGEAQAPEATAITSIYFDRPGFPLAERARAMPDDCLKVRTKEYWPDLGRGARDRVVFEVKRERNGLTQKRRLWLDRGALPNVLRGEAAQELLGGPAELHPALAVTYWREVHQQDAAWRITVDRDIRYHAVDAALALSPTRVGPELLPAAFAREERVVVEIKHLGAPLPSWLEALRERRSSYSKFAEGMARSLGARGREHGVSGG